MPWLIAALALLALVGLHLWWRRRYERLITETKSATTELESRQQALFNSMAEGVLVLDGSQRIQLANESLRKLFDVSRDPRGQTVLEAIRIEPLVELLKRLQTESVVRGFEVELPGIEDRWVEVNAAALIPKEASGDSLSPIGGEGQGEGAIELPRGGNLGGGVSGYVLVFHDLTRLKALENTRREFVANVSHELRTPLSLIKGFVETLLEGAKDNPEIAAQFLRTIEKHADRLTFLIEDLLTISRLESGQAILDLRVIDLREEVQRVVEDLKARAAERKTRLDNQIPADLLARADTDRLQQVLFNLIENAIKYGRNEGLVTVAAKPRGDQTIVVSVHDNGPGIPREAQDRIFERFYRVDRARSRETGGTGLGLAIVKHIVQAHGGEVWVESDPGAGTTFRFTLAQ